MSISPDLTDGFSFLSFIYQSTTNLPKYLCLYGLARWW